jgi:uncharacterized membrane-anchored protein YhcB (DUF1043 family)
MAIELDKSFAQGRADRMKEFDTLMKNINNDIKSINDEVLSVFKTTNEMLDRFEKEHQDMSAELKAELGKNLAERVEYTRSLLEGFQKRLSEIGRENQKMAQKLRKDLASGETERISEYNGIIKGIRTEIKNIKKASAGMLDDLLQNRVNASASWSKMQDEMDRIRKTGVAAPARTTAKKVEMKEAIKPAPVQAVKPAPVEIAREAPVKTEPKPAVPLTLEEKVLNYINKHPKGVKVSEMEEPLGETRMKLGFTAKALLDAGKVQKVDNIFFPLR